MQTRTIHLIAAARPNFMKIAPLYHALRAEEDMQPVVVHTGQHYDINMSDVFFRDLGLPEPDINLGVGSGSHAEQTGKVMMAYEHTLLETRPDLVVVVGDVNSTMAATLSSVKLGFKVAHLEAGLRSFDRTMPEEINRLVTDSLADILWTPSPDGDRNLQKEGIPRERIVRVGNIMIDSLEMLREKIEAQNVLQDLGLEAGNYGLATIHRPSNVDDPLTLSHVCQVLQQIAEHIQIVLPLHPRTRKKLVQTGYLASLETVSGLHLLEPINYVRFMNLVMNARLILTDSGGIQEETTYLGIPCLTLRPNTERPITVEQGTNELCSLDTVVEKAVSAIYDGSRRNAGKPELWDGKTAPRVVASMKRFLG